MLSNGVYVFAGILCGREMVMEVAGSGPAESVGATGRAGTCDGAVFSAYLSPPRRNKKPIADGSGVK